MRKSRYALAAMLVIAASGTADAFQARKAARSVQSAGTAAAEFDQSTSEMRPSLETFAADRQNLQRYYNVEVSEERGKRLKQFYEGWLSRLAQLNFDSMHQDAKVEYIAFRNTLEHEVRGLEIKAKQDSEAQVFLPFAPVIAKLEVSRQAMEPLKPSEAAATLSKLTADINETRKTVEGQLRAQANPSAIMQRKIRAAHAVLLANELRENLRTWYTFYDGYDPLFTWWAATDYKSTDAALQNYTTFLRERVLELRSAGQTAGAVGSAAANQGGGQGAGGNFGNRSGGGGNGGREGLTGPAVATAQAGETNDIIGMPVGRDALLSELAYEMIPYTPEQLLAIADKEFAWCEGEMKRASREMGFGEDWKRALEKVKNMYVEPGKQPEIIRQLALEAIQFMDDHDLVTIPPIARETWRMRMMTPQQQLLNPFFTGGETISVSYPTDSMLYENKLMSMRGNNIPFSKATVFHELIPGHELQGYMAARFRPYRSAALGRSAFVTEGWSLYWELLLWDMKFQKTPEERVGALFWHMHRCARIIFSLSFHLGKMTPDECINFLVDRVGFERENAVGEVRRSFTSFYGPLYQAGYLLGGMQLYALHKELVGTGKMTNRQFHDAILRENYLPVEMMRAELTVQPLSRDYRTKWKFQGEIAAQ